MTSAHSSACTLPMRRTQRAASCTWDEAQTACAGSDDGKNDCDFFLSEYFEKKINRFFFFFLRCALVAGDSPFSEGGGASTRQSLCLAARFGLAHSPRQIPASKDAPRVALGLNASQLLGHAHLASVSRALAQLLLDHNKLLLQLLFTTNC